MQYVERYIESSNWITLFLVGCVVLYTIAKYAYPKRFDEFIFLPINNKYFFVQGKNDEIKHPFNILLFVNQVISVSLFLFLFLKVTRPELHKMNPLLFVQLCTGYCFFILCKFSIEKIVGSIFSIDTLINNYLYQKLSYRNLLAIVIFIGNLFFFYTLQPTQNTLLIFVGIILVLNVITLFNSYKTIGKLILGNFFYFILYLCALEIAPYYILYKVLH